MRLFPRLCLRGITAATLLSAIVGATAVAQAAPLKVVASFSILADMTREVGGPAVEVHSLVPAGADAHVYSPTPADAQALAQAQLVIVNGLRYEGWIDRLIKAVGYKGELLIASSGIKVRQTTGGADPHAWQSLSNAQVYVENIRASLVRRLPTQAAAINARAANYRERLASLESETLARIERLPKERRRVVTGHDAFGYFAEAYGVDFQAPRGWSTDSEPSAKNVANVIRQLRRQQVGSLLVEDRSDPRLLERIAAEAGIKIGGRLYADALTAPGGQADTYLQLFRHNVDTLIEAMASGQVRAVAKP